MVTVAAIVLYWVCVEWLCVVGWFVGNRERGQERAVVYVV